MRRLAVLVPLALAATACGGGGKPLAETARPCLERLGQYVHHVPEPDRRIDSTVPRLPVLDPDNPPTVNRTTSRLPVPDDFQEYGEVLYPSDRPGANALQFFIFGDEELPRRIVAATKRAERTQLSLAPTGTQMRRFGQTILQWSSAPSPKQRARVLACLR